MASRFLDKEHGTDTSTAIADDSTGTAKVRNLPDAAGIVYDSVDGFIKYNDAGTIRTLVNTSEAQSLSSITLVSPTFSGTSTSTAVVNGPAPVAFTAGTTLALTAALHAGKVVYTTDVAADYRLPAATGTGNKYVIVLGATQTGASTIKVNATPGTDTMIGNAVLFNDAAVTTEGYTAGATADTIDLLGTGNSTGGMIGGLYEFIDVASALWHVNIVSDAAGTEATPFSASVP